MLKGNLRCVRMIALLDMERIDMLIVFILMGAFLCYGDSCKKKTGREKLFMDLLFLS